MIRPRWIADVEARAGPRARDEMAGDAQAAAAAGRLHGRDAAGLQRRMVLAVENLFDAVIETGVAGDRDIRLAVLLLEDGFLGGLHAGEHGRAALLVLIDADREIDLAGVRIGAKTGS